MQKHLPHSNKNWKMIASKAVHGKGYKTLEDHNSEK